MEHSKTSLLVPNVHPPRAMSRAEGSRRGSIFTGNNNDYEEVLPQDLQVQIANRVYMESRRQSRMILSINCSKALDPLRYQELVDIMSSEKVPSIVRTKSAIGGDRTDRSLKNGSAIQQKNMQLLQSLQKSTQRNSILGNTSQISNVRMKSEGSFPKPHNTLNPMHIKFIKDQLTGRNTDRRPFNDSQVSVMKGLITQNREQLSSIMKDTSQGLSMQEFGRVKSSPTKSSYGDTTVYFPKAKEHDQSQLQSRALDRLKDMLKKKRHEGSFERSNFDVYHFHIDSFQDEISLNKINTFGIEDEEKNKSMNSSSYVYGMGGSSLSLKRQRTKVQNEFPAVKLQKLVSKTAKEKEKLISRSLLKDSPMLLNRGQRNIQNFMMNMIQTDKLLVNEPQPFNIPRKTKTLLRITEIVDNEKDFIGMEISEIQKLSKEELQVAYNRLFRAIRPLFSGSVDPVINIIDYKKAMHESQMEHGHQHKRSSPRNQVEVKLIEELKRCREQLDSREMLSGFWSILQTNGAMPDSREGSSSCIIEGKMYLFGGFSRNLFNDLRYYELGTNKWKLIQSQENAPLARFAQVMISYKNKLVIFGGAGPYIQSIKMRLSFNDICIFDCEEEKWLPEVNDIEKPPSKRMNHAGSLMGSVMLVHGGFNTEQRQLLSDFQMFDIDLMKWVEARIYIGESRIDALANFRDPVAIQNSIGRRHMHSLTGVYDQNYYDSAFANKRNGKSRAMWVHKRKFDYMSKDLGQNFNEGFYLFGGVDENGELKNDLWFIEPFYFENEKHISTYSYSFDHKTVLCLQTSLIDNARGRPPCPRIQHAATTFTDVNKQHFLVIYGGRNDSIYADTLNVALNDLCLYNVNSNEWIAVGLYGSIPCSRWAHVICQNSASMSDGLLLLGGVNLQSYCRSKLYHFKFYETYHKQGGVSMAEESNQHQFIKDKLEIVKELITKGDA